MGCATLSGFRSSGLRSGAAAVEDLWVFSRLGSGGKAVQDVGGVYKVRGTILGVPLFWKLPVRVEGCSLVSYLVFKRSSGQRV